jgi:hypothetical protein
VAEKREDGGERLEERLGRWWIVGSRWWIVDRNLGIGEGSSGDSQDGAEWVWWAAMWRVIFVFWWGVMGAGALGAAVDAVERGEESVWGRPGMVVMLRHAYAPGVGDPRNFALGDCATQRNLDETGRAQARALGERWRRELGEARVGDVRVYTSEWCRCRETGEPEVVGRIGNDQCPKTED